MLFVALYDRWTWSSPVRHLFWESGGRRFPAIQRTSVILHGLSTLSVCTGIRQWSWLQGGDQGSIIMKTTSASCTPRWHLSGRGRRCCMRMLIMCVQRNSTDVGTGHCLQFEVCSQLVSICLFFIAIFQTQM